MELTREEILEIINALGASPLARKLGSLDYAHTYKVKIKPHHVIMMSTIEGNDTLLHLVKQVDIEEVAHCYCGGQALKPKQTVMMTSQKEIGTLYDNPLVGYQFCKECLGNYLFPF